MTVTYHLLIKTWGLHFYGSLYNGDAVRKSVRKIVNESDARQLNREEESTTYFKGSTTQRFFTRQDVIDAAINQAEKETSAVVRIVEGLPGLSSGNVLYLTPTKNK